MHRLLLLVLIASCSPTTYAFTPTTRGSTPKPEGCTFQLVEATPDNVEEIGTLELYNGEAPTSVDKFRKAVAAQVCSSGGDVLVPAADDKGRYTKGTIFRYTKRPVDAAPPIVE